MVKFEKCAISAVFCGRFAPYLAGACHILYKKGKGGVKMKKEIASKIVNLVNFSLKVDANSTNTVSAYQPKLPKQYSDFKKN